MKRLQQFPSLPCSPTVPCSSSSTVECLLSLPDGYRLPELPNPNRLTEEAVMRPVLGLAYTSRKGPWRQGNFKNGDTWPLLAHGRIHCPNISSFVCLLECLLFSVLNKNSQNLVFSLPVTCPRNPSCLLKIAFINCLLVSAVSKTSDCRRWRSLTSCSILLRSHISVQVTLWPRFTSVLKDRPGVIVNSKCHVWFCYKSEKFFIFWTINGTKAKQMNSSWFPINFHFVHVLSIVIACLKSEWSACISK